MEMQKSLSPIIKIAKYTIADEVCQRSFIVMFVVCAAFIFLMRGCYHGHYTVNGQEVEAVQIVTMVSKITFHAVAVGVMFLAALLSMRIFRRDRDDGTQSCILSKQITRLQYITGKVIGLWVLLMGFMFIMHGIVFITASINSKAIMPEYLIASVLCSFNLLFVILTVLLLSLMMPDIAAFLCVLGIGIVGAVADGIYAVNHSPMAQAMIQQPGPQSDFTFWNIVYYLWPKLSGAQHFASSFIGSVGSSAVGSVYPLINILIYCVIAVTLLLQRFRSEDIV